MRVLLDTNVLLDVLLKRDPWVAQSSAVWQAHDEGQIVGHVMACAIAGIFYIARRLTALETARTAVRASVWKPLKSVLWIIRPWNRHGRCREAILRITCKSCVPALWVSMRL